MYIVNLMNNWINNLYYGVERNLVLQFFVLLSMLNLTSLHSFLVYSKSPCYAGCSTPYKTTYLLKIWHYYSLQQSLAFRESTLHLKPWEQWNIRNITVVTTRSSIDNPHKQVSHLIPKLHQQRKCKSISYCFSVI